MCLKKKCDGIVIDIDNHQTRKNKRYLLWPLNREGLGSLLLLNAGANGFWCRYVLLELLGSWCTNSSFPYQPYLSLSGCQKKNLWHSSNNIYIYIGIKLITNYLPFFPLYFATRNGRAIQFRLMEVQKCWICRYAQYSPSAEKSAVKKIDGRCWGQLWNSRGGGWDGSVKCVYCES